MNITHQLVRLFIAIAIMSVSTACASITIQPIDQVLHHLEEADNIASIQESIFENYENQVLIDAVIERLAVENSNISLKARNRLWVLLARAPGDSEQGQITRLDRVQELEIAFEEGQDQTKLEVLKSVSRILPELRASLLEIISDNLSVETNRLLVIASIDSISRIGGLGGSGREYVLAMAQDLTQSNLALHNELFVQEGAAVGSVTTAGQRLQSSAISAGILLQSEFIDAMNFVSTFDDNNELVATAMARTGHSDLILLGRNHSERATWLSEYTRRFCLDSGKAHRSKYSIAYYTYLYEEYEDMDDAMCDSFYQIQSSCTQNNFRGYGTVIQSIETMCGG